MKEELVKQIISRIPLKTGQIFHFKNANCKENVFYTKKFEFCHHGQFYIEVSKREKEVIKMVGSMPEIRVKVSSELKKDIESIARMKGKNLSSIVREALKLYVQEKYYRKTKEILNIEDRVGMAVATELYPELEEIKNRLDMIADAVQTQNSQAEKTPAKEEEEKIDFPKVPGLHYKVDGNNVIYEDGSIYNLYLGAWLVTKEEVANWKRKMERERNLLR